MFQSRLRLHSLRQQLSRRSTSTHTVSPDDNLLVPILGRPQLCGSDGMQGVVPTGLLLWQHDVFEVSRRLFRMTSTTIIPGTGLLNESANMGYWDGSFGNTYMHALASSAAVPTSSAFTKTTRELSSQMIVFTNVCLEIMCCARCPPSRRGKSVAEALK